MEGGGTRRRRTTGERRFGRLRQEHALALPPTHLVQEVLDVVDAQRLPVDTQRGDGDAWREPQGRRRRPKGRQEGKRWTLSLPFPFSTPLLHPTRHARHGDTACTAHHVQAPNKRRENGFFCSPGVDDAVQVRLHQVRDDVHVLELVQRRRRLHVQDADDLSVAFEGGGSGNQGIGW